MRWFGVGACVCLWVGLHGSIRVICMVSDMAVALRWHEEDRQQLALELMRRRGILTLLLTGASPPTARLVRALLLLLLRGQLAVGCGVGSNTACGGQGTV